MAERLDGDVVLQIDEALQQVETIRGALESALADAASTFTEALGGLPPVPIDADASGVPADIENAAADATPVVPVEADASGIPTEIENAAESAQPAPIPVDADTSAAEAALDDLAAKAEETGAGLEGFGGGAKTAAAGADLATGSTAGLAGALGEVNPKAAGAAGAVAAGAAAIGVMFNQAVEAEGATQRFEGSLGNMADRVENVNIGGLDTDLSSLALTLGSDDDALRQAVTSFFQLGEASGAARPEVAATTEEIVALSARAVALRPNLGTVDQVASRMGQALTRGGRFAAQFGIDLASAEISARAMADTGKTTAAELTFYEKAAAGAALATEKYGAGLDEIVAEGAANSEIKLRRLKQTVIENVEALGMPLTAPIFEAMEEGIPVAEQVGRLVAELGGAAIPVLSAAASGLLPILQLTADLLELIPPPLLASVAGTLLMARMTRDAASGTRAWLLPLTAILPLLNAIDPALGSGAVSVASFGFAGAQLGKMLPNTTAGMGALAGVGVGVGQSIGGATGQAVSFASAGALLGQALIPIPFVGAAAGAAVGVLGAVLLGAGEDAKKAHEEIATLAGELDKLGATKGAAHFLESEISSFDIIRGDLEDFKKDFRDLAETSPAAAQRVAEGLRAMADQGDGLASIVVTGTDLNAMLEHGATSFAKSNAAKREADLVNQDLAGSEQTLVEQQAIAQQALDSFVSSAIGKLPGLSEVLNRTRDDVGNFGLALNNSVSPEVFLENLNETITGIANFQANIATLIEKGLGNIASFVVSQGPELGGAFAQAVLSGNPMVALAIDSQLPVYDAGVANLEGFLRGPAAMRMGGAWSASVAGIPPATTEAMDSAAASISGRVPVVEGAASAAGSQAAGGFGTGVAPLPGLAGTAVSSAGGTITAGATGLSNPAYVAGAQVGAQFGDGMIGGLASRAGLLYEKVREVVRGMVTAANNAGSPTEHLWFDAAASWVRAAAAGTDATASELAVAAQRAAAGASIVGAPPAPTPAGGADVGLASVLRSLADRGSDGGTTLVVLHDRRDLKPYLPADVDIDSPGLNPR